MSLWRERARSITERYRRLFSLHEIEQSRTLLWLMGVLLLPFLESFGRYANSKVITRQTFDAGEHLCPPHFQSCGSLYFMEALPEGYSQYGSFMVLFAFVAGAGFALYRGSLVWAHALTSLAFLAKLAYLGLLTYWNRGNYDYYHLTLLVVVLFLPHKLAFARYAFVFLYFLAATVKFHPGWVLGTYFTSIKTGMPIFGDALSPLMTNAVTVMEMAGTWFLLSRRWYLQRAALAFFVVFHLYSGLLVGYTYPVTCLPPLLVLFTSLHDYEPLAPWGARAIPGYLLLAMWLLVQVGSELVPGDRKVTLEANEYGLYMFEANHQCVSRETTYFAGGGADAQTRQSSNARNRCDPYQFLFRIKTRCERSEGRIDRVAWQFDHSINGGPFHRIVDVPDACALHYRLFTHHAWIATPEEGAPIVGYPVENYYR